MLSAKYSLLMTLSDLAKKLGQKGGQMRAKRLLPSHRRKIASLGGRSRSLSLRVKKHIVHNFHYLQAVKGLSKSPKISRVSTLKTRLPGHYSISTFNGYDSDR